MQSYQEKVSFLSRELEEHKASNEETSLIQHRAFDALKELECQKAGIEGELDELKARFEETQIENANLHQVAQDASSVYDEKVQLCSTVA